MHRIRLAVAMLACAGAALPAGIGLSGAAAPIGTPLDTGVQPGGEAHIDGSLCTFNFLFQGSDGHRYMGTAGHCAIASSPVQGPDDQAVEQSWEPGAGQEVSDVNDERIGEFAYAVLDNTKDFSLIRLDPGVEASPQMAHFGGPTGLNTDVSAEPVVLHWYGNGIGLGMTIPARTGIAPSMPNGDHVYMLAVADPGDSGAGVISDDGRAVGVLVSGGVSFGAFGEDSLDAGDVTVTRLGPQLARAEQVTGVHFELVTAEQL
jgi:hypothetical protein